MLKLIGTGNCGNFEIVGLSLVDTPENALLQLVPQVKFIPFNFAFVTFSGVTKVAPTLESAKHIGRDARKDDYGGAFAQFIRDHKLGKVIETDSTVNWSDNEIKVWIWTINRERTYALADKIIAHRNQWS